MTEIFTAKTVDEAKSLAAAKFGTGIDKIKFEIIDEGKKGFLGLGKSDAKVKAVYEPEKTAAAKPVKPAAAHVSEKPAEIVEKAENADKTSESVVEEVQKSAEKPVETAVETVENSVEKVENPTESPAPADDEEEKSTDIPQNVEKTVETKKSVEKSDDEEFSLDNFTLIEDESLIEPKVKIAMDYITSVLRAMDIEPEFTVYQNETGAVVNIESNNNGTVIGRRGETLDSLQYLCSIIANKGDKDYFRITIDCLGYRSKRKETLEQLAVKVAKSVLRTGRSQPLEPMNPYERRVIHSAVSEIEGVSSRSVGEEPYRKIIISSNNPKPNNKRRNGRSDRSNNRRNDKRNRRNNNEPIERKPIDLSTSFEKDYKKPKPEDSMEGGLYGKIEL